VKIANAGGELLTLSLNRRAGIPPTTARKTGDLLTVTEI